MEKELISSEINKKILVIFAVPALIGLAFTIGICCDGWAWFDYAFYGGAIELLLSWGGLLLLLVGVIMFFMVKKSSLTVTDQRVYGKTMFGVRVDIPLDSISSVGIGTLDTIIVASSSGRLKFIGVKNKEIIHRTITSLLQNRTKEFRKDNSVDDLSKLKALLDSGVITQDEFDAKKKQILGL